MIVREMNDKDINEIVEIENLCFENGRYSKDQIIYELHNELSKSYVCEIDNKIVGFLFYMITFNSSTIVQIATHPSYQRKGIAKNLMNKMFEQISSLGYGEVETSTLELRKGNDAAHNLYLSLGYKDIVIKPKYYTNGDDAIYMSKVLI